MHNIQQLLVLLLCAPKWLIEKFGNKKLCLLPFMISCVGLALNPKWVIKNSHCYVVHIVISHKVMGMIIQAKIRVGWQLLYTHEHKVIVARERIFT